MNNTLINKLKQQPRHGMATRDLSGDLPRSIGNAIPIVSANNAIAANQATATINNQVQQLAQSLANQMVAEMQQSQILARNGRTFTKI